MRILFVTHYALPHLGGVEIVVDGLARTLASGGHEVTQISTEALRGGETAYEAPHTIVRVAAWNGLERIGLPVPIVGAAAESVLRHAIGKADVVHAHGMLFPITAAALRVAAELNHPCRVITEHSGPLPRFGSPLELIERLAMETAGRQTLRRAHAIITVNEEQAGFCARLAPAAAVSTIWNGVDFALFRPADGEERARLRSELGWDERPRVLYAGRVMRRKGAHVALRAAALADEGELELVVVGPGEVARGLRNVRHLGPASRERMAAIYRAADLFVLPSVREGFPVTVQEAMASGLPVLVSDPTVHRRLAAIDPLAATLTAARPAALLAAIRALLNDSREMDARSAAALRVARAEFDLQRAGDAHLRIYEEVMQRRR